MEPLPRIHKQKYRIRAFATTFILMVNGVGERGVFQAFWLETKQKFSFCHGLIQSRLALDFQIAQDDLKSLIFLPHIPSVGLYVRARAHRE